MRPSATGHTGREGRARQSRPIGARRLRAQEAERPVHYLLLKGEGHGFSKNDNYHRVLELTDRFLDHYVFGDSSVKVDD